MTLQELLKNDAASRAQAGRQDMAVITRLACFPQPFMTFDPSLESANLRDPGLVSSGRRGAAGV